MSVMTLFDSSLYDRLFQDTWGRELERFITQGMDPSEANECAYRRATEIMGNSFTTPDRERYSGKTLRDNELDYRDYVEEQSLGGKTYKE